MKAFLRHSSVAYWDEPGSPAAHIEARSRLSLIPGDGESVQLAKEFHAELALRQQETFMDFLRERGIDVIEARVQLDTVIGFGVNQSDYDGNPNL